MIYSTSSLPTPTLVCMIIPGSQILITSSLCVPVLYKPIECAILHPNNSSLYHCSILPYDILVHTAAISIASNVSSYAGVVRE